MDVFKINGDDNDDDNILFLDYYLLPSNIPFLQFECELGGPKEVQLLPTI